LAALPSATASAFASTQAAWRFYHNPRVGLPDLVAPLHQAAHHALSLCPAPFALVVVDWSNLNFHPHTSKADQVLFSTGSDRGYELTSALLVDTTAGDSLAGLALPAALVYVIDCEADSVDHLRKWHRQGQLLLVRSDGTRKARYAGAEHTLKQIAALLQQRGAFGQPRAVRYHGRAATQTVAEVEVTLERPAYRRRGAKRRVIRGRPLTLRLVVSLVHDGTGQRLAGWYLLTNLPPSVEAAEVALWYYWRWRIETDHPNDTSRQGWGDSRPVAYHLCERAA
jgi:hypothetical protein